MCRSWPQPRSPSEVLVLLHAELPLQGDHSGRRAAGPWAVPMCRPGRERQEEGAGGRRACAGTAAGRAGLSWHHPPAYRKSGRNAANSNHSCDSEAAGWGAEILHIQQKCNKGKEKRERARLSRGPRLPPGSPGAAQGDELPNMNGGWAGWCRTDNRDLKNLDAPRHRVSSPHAATAVILQAGLIC